MGWGALLSAAVQAYSAYDAAKENKEAAKEAGKSRDTVRTPYYNDAIQSIIPFLMKEQQATYERRMNQYGAKAGDFSPFAALLSGVPQGYTGVGYANGQPQVNPNYAGSGSAFEPGGAGPAPQAPGGGLRAYPQDAPRTPQIATGPTISPNPMPTPASPQMSPQMAAQAAAAQGQAPAQVNYWDQAAELY